MSWRIEWEKSQKWKEGKLLKSNWAMWIIEQRLEIVCCGWKIVISVWEWLKSYSFIRDHSQKYLKMTLYVIKIEHTEQDDIGNNDMMLEESRRKVDPELELN